MCAGFTDLLPDTSKKGYGNYEMHEYDTDGAALLEATKAWRASPDTTERLIQTGDTPSMLGSGLNGSHVIFKPSREFTVGDLAVIPTGKGNVHSIHAITAVDPVKGIYTKGTFNRIGDGWTPYEQVMGKVLKAYKKR